MTYKTRRLIFAVVLVAIVATLGLVVLFEGRQRPLPPLPNPNGYDDFLRASTAVTGPVGNFDTLDHDGLRKLVSANSEPLRVLRLGLSRDCAVSTEFYATNFSAF